jgi:hypothetical protein
VSESGFAGLYRFLHDHEPPAVLSDNDIYRLESTLRGKPLDEEISLRQRFGLPVITAEQLRIRSELERIRENTAKRLKRPRK